MQAQCNAQKICYLVILSSKTHTLCIIHGLVRRNVESVSTLLSEERSTEPHAFD